jgi:hypothetical protein
MPSTFVPDEPLTPTHPLGEIQPTATLKVQRAGQRVRARPKSDTTCSEAGMSQNSTARFRRIGLRPPFSRPSHGKWLVR